MTFKKNVIHPISDCDAHYRLWLMNKSHS